MTNLESIAELRNHGVLDFAPNIRRKVCMALDGIEREIAEKYMELPVDADGVLIRIGDTVSEVGDCVPMKVMSLTFYEDCVDVNACGMNPKLLVHVKPRTVEDVLRDCCNEWNEHCGDDWESGVYAKYANELRDLIKEGEL